MPPLQENNPLQWSAWESPDDVLADLDKLGEDNKMRPILIKAGEELKTYFGVEEAKKALTPQLKWMFADMKDYSVAKHNPFRWSANEGAEAMVEEMQKLSDKDKKRKVCIRAATEDREYESVNACLVVISPSVNWMFADLPDQKFAYHNPFRWSGHDNMEDAYTHMQLMSEEDLARPIIVREGGKETKFDNVRKAFEALAPLVGKGGGEGTWSMEHAFEIGKKGEEDKFQGKAARLHTGEIDSVHAAVDSLNDGGLKCPMGICVMWSVSHDAYYLLFRTDKKDKAFSDFDLGSES